MLRSSSKLLAGLTNFAATLWRVAAFAVLARIAVWSAFPQLLIRR